MSEKTILAAGKLTPISVQTGFDEFCFIRLCNSPEQDARRMARRKRDALKTNAKKTAVNGSAALFVAALTNLATRYL